MRAIPGILVALALVIERFSSLRAIRVAPPRLLDEVLSVSSKSLPAPEVVNKLAANSVLGVVLASGLRAMIGEPRITEEGLRIAFETAGRHAVHRLERYLNTLGTIAAAGPLLGLFGTVVGMIQMFLGILSHGVGDVNQLAGGIGKALVCTATGMIVAIPALMFHRYFRGRIAGYIVDMEHEAIQLLDMLGPRQAVPANVAPGTRGITPPLDAA